MVNCIQRLEPNREVKVQSAEGLQECRKMLTMARTGKLNGYLLEEWPVRAAVWQAQAPSSPLTVPERQWSMIKECQISERAGQRF